MFDTPWDFFETSSEISVFGYGRTFWSSISKKWGRYIYVALPKTGVKTSFSSPSRHPVRTHEVMRSFGLWDSFLGTGNEIVCTCVLPLERVAVGKVLLQVWAILSCRKCILATKENTLGEFTCMQIYEGEFRDPSRSREGFKLSFRPSKGMNE